MAEKFKLRYLALLLFLSTTGLGARAQTINYIEQTGSWLYVYDSAGKKLCTKYAENTGEVVGWGGTYWISRRGDWYYLWTAKGQKYKTLYAPNIGKVMAVNNNTFVSRYNKQWLYTFDKNGKKLRTKYSPQK